MKIKIIKLREADNPLFPNNIETGHERVGYIHRMWFREPEVGERFWVDRHWSTSAVQEILSKNTFRTYNSIYKWKILEAKTDEDDIKVTPYNTKHKRK